MLIKNGRVIDYKTDEKLDVRIEEKKIVQIDKDLQPLKGEKVVDATGYFVVSGLIDLHFHINNISSKKNESFEEAIKGSLKGGLTTVLISPDCEPAIDDEFASSFTLLKAKSSGFNNVFISGSGIKDGALANVSILFKTGVKAVTIDSDISTNTIQRIFQYTKTEKAPLIVNPKNSSIESHGVIHDGEYSALMGLPSLPFFAESSEIGKIIEVAKALESNLHINYVTCGASVDILRSESKKLISAGTPLVNLILSDKDCMNFNSMNKTFPPLRSEDDKELLINAVKDGVIDVISSNHRAISHTEKDKPFANATNGIAVSAIYLQLIYTFLIKTGKLSFQEVLKAASKKPAELLGLNKGEISVGFDGDLVIFDPNDSTVANTKQFISKDIGNIAMYEEKLSGSVKSAIVLGEEVSE